MKPKKSPPLLNKNNKIFHPKPPFFGVPAVNFRHLRHWESVEQTWPHMLGSKAQGQRDVVTQAAFMKPWGPTVKTAQGGFPGKNGLGRELKVGNQQVPTLWSAKMWGFSQICVGVFCCLSTSHWNWDKMDSHWVDFIHAPEVKLKKNKRPDKFLYYIVLLPFQYSSLEKYNIKFQIASFKDMIYLFIHVPMLSSFCVYHPHLICLQVPRVPGSQTHQKARLKSSTRCHRPMT